MNADDYIFFEDRPTPEARTTRVVSVLNRRSSDELGQIRWYGPWRQYCLHPSDNTIFNPDCMDRIGEEAKAMTTAHRSKFQNMRAQQGSAVRERFGGD